MKIIYLPKEKIDEEVSKIVIDEINHNPKCVLGLATGSSPVGVYKKLINAVEEGKVSFKDVITFNLDEYVGLDEHHEQSYRHFMNHNLFNHIDIDMNNTNVPNGLIDKKTNPSDYDEIIASRGGIAIQLLGLGSDGHIAFNEPGTPFDSLTHITELTESTIKDNSRFFDRVEDVPTKAITMGLQSIMNARKIIMIVTGKGKENILKDFFKSDITLDIPCTILKRHSDVCIYIDSDIYSEINFN